MKKVKKISECYLEEKYGIHHDRVPKRYLNQYYMIGNLFPHKKICSWCIIKLQDIAKPILTDADTYDMEIWKQRNPGYVKVAKDVGMDLLRTELKRNLFEQPYEPKITETGIPVEFGEPGERVGNPPETPKKPNVIVY
ncbi:MAG: hypothetical protein L6N96_02970 [Candidatus Methylarchaceae archaeon HK02M2]|nr:hypothetical protein [Candidatus Methylarchaceae archaeon HK02M2]